MRLDNELARGPVMALDGAGKCLGNQWHLLLRPFAMTLSDTDQPPAWPALDITAWAQFGHHDRFGKKDRVVKPFPALRGKGRVFPA